MVPVRSELTQPLLPSVLPTRLFPGRQRFRGHRARWWGPCSPPRLCCRESPCHPRCQGRRRSRSGVSADGAVGQHGRAGNRLALIVVHVAGEHAAAVSGGVSADGAVGQRGRAGKRLAGRGVLAASVHAAAVDAGGVSADGAVGQRGRAAELNRPPPLTDAELPLTVQLVSVVVPPE